MKGAKVMFVIGNVQSKNNLHYLRIACKLGKESFWATLKKEQTSLADGNIFLILLFLTSFSKKIE
ncbi:hypothetical protein BKI52_23700 [marine bacterium AO1-C]|nr:hypothetical protein BKI52_23700 [marine bacterium AO1-C]